MEESIATWVSGFLSETAPLMMQVDNLPFDTAAELYDMLEIAAIAVTDNISAVDPELRAEICRREDEVLERIVDFDISFNIPHTIYTPAVQGYRRWANVELMKDKGLVGYTLAKEIGAKPVMCFGANPSDYPYLSDLPEMELLYSDGVIGRPAPYYELLEKSHREMDTLILHGMYNETINYLDAYRSLRPDGKVYCGLDMNSGWMSRINWGDEAAMHFARQCDVIATSCRSLRDELNRNPNVRFACHWYPNAFLKVDGLPVIADTDKKDNIILTVGRIGTAQKNNEELLNAFAKASAALAGWVIRLVGPIDPAFQAYITQYFIDRPDLKDRVIFVGPISDKKELFKEYTNAKVFALTSQHEGGTPNVYSEALLHGCMFITSDIDAADDITNYGELGYKYRRGDIDALASAFVKLCSRAHKRGFQSHIPKAFNYAAKYYDWNRNAKKLAYMLYKDHQ